MIAQNSRFNTDIYWDFVESKATDGSGLSATAPIGNQGVLAGVPCDYADCKCVVITGAGNRFSNGRMYVLGQVNADISATDQSQWVAAVGTRSISFVNGMIAAILASTLVEPAIISYSRSLTFVVASNAAHITNLKKNHVTNRDSV
jgi:hypothetical protein